MKSTTETPQPWGTYAPGKLLGLWLKLLHSLPPGRIWRRVALWLRKPAKCAINEWIDLTVWGLKLRLRSKGNLSEQRMILMPQFLDQIEFQTIASALANGGTFFDIGANAGAYSLWAASCAGKGTRIESFEPDPDLCASLRFNKETNALSSITIQPLALGRQTGEMSLIRGKENLGENHVRSAGAENSLPVQMTTLPRFLSDHNISKIDVLKIDIEGYECDALEPLFLEAHESKWPTLLICELVHDDNSQLATLLYNHGYKLTSRGRLNGIYRLNP
jgi:FkbM family methyltransferase